MPAAGSPVIESSLGMVRCGVGVRRYSYASDALPMRGTSAWINWRNKLHPRNIPLERGTGSALQYNVPLDKRLATQLCTI